MRRRSFIAGLGSAAAWPLVATAQSERVRRIGVLMQATADEPEPQARLAAFVQGLEEKGWSIGRNLRIDTRWSMGDFAHLRKEATDLAATGPDVVLAGVGLTTPALQQATRTVPIVFAQAIDPIGAFYVETLARPGGNMTGFIQCEYSLSGKWLELLKEIAPQIVRVAVLRQQGPAGIAQWAIIQALAQSMGVEPKPIELRNAGEIEQTVAAFAQSPNSGLIMVVSPTALAYEDLIPALAVRYQLPATYPYRSFVVAGGLITYGANIAGLYRRAAGYVDRILRGERPGDLPVQAPTKYELVINLKAAKRLGLTVPSAVLARADEVIE
jgi:putative ABC transport system substrate-binding protein